MGAVCIQRSRLRSNSGEDRTSSGVEKPAGTDKPDIIISSKINTTFYILTILSKFWCTAYFSFNCILL
jgi:hypothetical protein